MIVLPFWFSQISVTNAFLFRTPLPRPRAFKYFALFNRFQRPPVRIISGTFNSPLNNCREIIKSDVSVMKKRVTRTPRRRCVRWYRETQFTLLVPSVSNQTTCTPPFKQQINNSSKQQQPSATITNHHHHHHQYVWVSLDLETTSTTTTTAT